MITSRRRARIARRRRLHSLRVRAVLAGALVLGVGGSATLAAWTDQEVATTTVTAGTFSLVSRTATTDAFASHGPSETAASLTFAATGLYPGQVRVAWIQLQNSGSVPGTATLTAVNANAGTATANTTLSAAIEVRYVSVAAPGDMSSCTTSTTGGTVVTGLGTLPTLTPLTIAAGATVGYCIVLTLPTTTPSAAQGGTASPTWTFTGTTG